MTVENEDMGVDVSERIGVAPNSRETAYSTDVIGYYRVSAEAGDVSDTFEWKVCTGYHDAEVALIGDEVVELGIDQSHSDPEAADCELR